MEFREGSDPALAEGALKRLVKAYDLEVFGLGFCLDLARKGTADLYGREIKGPRSLATAAQIYRDPTIETARIIYLKNSEIVGESAVTARLPNMARFEPSGEELMQYIKAEKETLKADSYYLLHNHPSGDPTPSHQDVKMTRDIAQGVPGFRGHIIINSNKFAFVGRSGKPKVGKMNLGPDRLLTPDIDHEFLGKEVTKLVYFGKKLTQDSRPVIIGTARTRVRVILGLSDKFVEVLESGNAERTGALLSRLRRHTGSPRLYIVLPSTTSRKQRNDLIRSMRVIDAMDYGLVSDIVTDDGEWSLRQTTSSDPSEGHALGRNIEK